MNNNIILYTTNDGKARVELYEFGENLYLAQSVIAELFDTLREEITMHISNILKDEELSEDAVVRLLPNNCQSVTNEVAQSIVNFLAPLN